MADRELLAAARDGDGPAFGIFYRRRQALVLAFLVRRTSTPEVAADLLAETFAAALAAVLDERRELPEEPVGWIVTIARNKLTDSIRRGEVEAAARTRLQMEPLRLHDSDVAEVERLGEQTDLLAELAELLPADQLDALRERVLEGKDYAEIAGALRCSEAVVRKRVSRALTTLRARMEARA